MQPDNKTKVTIPNPSVKAVKEGKKNNVKTSKETSAIVKKKEKTKSKNPPSMEVLRRHIADHFPTFYLATLLPPNPPEKKGVTFAKGLTPLNTPKSYYHHHPPHSYAKGFTP